MTDTGSTTRRRLLTTATAAGSLVVSGCLTDSNIDHLVNGPPIEVEGLEHSKVFLSISAAETFSFGHILSASVSLTGTALFELGVTELEVFAKGKRPYSASAVSTSPGPKREKVVVTTQLPVDDTAIIAATDENNTLVEAIRVTAGGTPIYTRPSLRDEKKKRVMPTQMPEIPEILTTTLQTSQTQFSTNAAVYGEVKNTSNTDLLTHLEVKAEFLNEAGEVVDTSFESVRNFSPDEIWEVVVPYLGDASDADSATLSIETAIAGTEPVPPTNITLLEKKFETPESDLKSPTMAGQIENTGTEELPYLEADAKFYTENGKLLGDAADSVTGLDPGQVWEFSVEFPAYSNEIADRVDSAELSFVT
jgi:hypothetical protein